MKKKYTFIIFCTDNNWYSYQRKPHFELLKKFGKLLVFEKPFKIYEYKYFKYIFSPIKEDSENLCIIKPLTFFPLFLTKFSNFFKKIFFIPFKKYIKKFSIKNSIKVGIYLDPCHSLYLNNVDLDVTTFDYCDKFDLYDHLSISQKNETNLYEKQMLSKVNIVFATSINLKKEAKKYNKYSFWIPNSINYDQFVGSSKDIPKDLISIPSPLIGFIGNINLWLDYKLINYLSEKNKNYSFVFLGNENFNTDNIPKEYYEIRSKKNVYFLGHIDYFDLYKYIMHFDICAHYLKFYEFAKYVHPNKFYMYLALGKPVVTTDFNPYLKKYFKNNIYFSTNYSDFNDNLNNALKNKHVSINSKIDFVKKSNVPFRVERIMKSIETYVKK